MKIIYNSKGRSGNIYYILGTLQEEMRKQKRYTEFNTIRDRVFEAGSYEEALKIISEVATLVDVAEE